MDNRAVALKLILDHLDTADISTVEHRMEVQKAIYLVQASGVALGYSFGWYLKGPYSPGLTRDYYSLGDDPAAENNAALKAKAIEKLELVRRLIAAQVDGLRKAHKLELFASLHYLIKVSGKSEAAARTRIAEVKPHLAAHVGAGLQVLKDEGLL